MYTFEDIKKVDMEVAEAITAEFDRQSSHIELIASENWVSPAVMSAMGSVLTNKYAEGYPGKRYYGGCDCVDVGKMREGAAYLEGEHDFASFCNVRTNVEDTVRTIDEIVIENAGSDLTIRITGNGFLYNMVRIIAGTLIRVGRGFYTPEKVKEILDAKERTEAGVTAPPEGLTLVKIEYGTSAG